MFSPTGGRWGGRRRGGVGPDSCHLANATPAAARRPARLFQLAPISGYVELQPGWRPEVTHGSLYPFGGPSARSASQRSRGRGAIKFAGGNPSRSSESGSRWAVTNQLARPIRSDGAQLTVAQAAWSPRRTLPRARTAPPWLSRRWSRWTGRPPRGGGGGRRDRDGHGHGGLSFDASGGAGSAARILGSMCTNCPRVRNRVSAVSSEPFCDTTLQRPTGQRFCACHFMALFAVFDVRTRESAGLRKSPEGQVRLTSRWGDSCATCRHVIAICPQVNEGTLTQGEHYDANHKQEGQTGPGGWSSRTRADRRADVYTRLGPSESG
jgi:hypothetical protein